MAGSEGLGPRRGAIGLALLAFVGALGAAEGWVRIADPRPRVQMVRRHGLRLVDGTPLWQGSTDRENRECAEKHPERTRVLFFGSSITYGSNLTPAEAFTSRLQKRLDALRPSPGICVLSFAQPGYSFEQKLATARIEVARYRPALLMWESWAEWFDYELIGDTAYGIHGYRVRPDGFIGLAGVPDGVNRFLFLRSRLYEYAVLAVGERASTWHAAIRAFGDRRHVPVYAIEHELAGEDYLALRMDPCCHFNAKGHEALEPVMERIVLERLDGPAIQPDLE